MIIPLKQQSIFLYWCVMALGLVVAQWCAVNLFIAVESFILWEPFTFGVSAMGLRFMCVMAAMIATLVTCGEGR